MTLKCYRKPNRKKARVFTAKDVARISKYAADDGADIKVMIVSIAKALGIAYLICILAKSLNAVLVIARIMAKIGGALAIAGIIERILAALSGNVGTIIRKIPAIRVISILIILLLESLSEILNAVAVIAEDLSVIESATEFMNDLCRLVNLPS